MPVVELLCTFLLALNALFIFSEAGTPKGVSISPSYGRVNISPTDQEPDENHYSKNTSLFQNWKEKRKKVIEKIKVSQYPPKYDVHDAFEMFGSQVEKRKRLRNMRQMFAESENVNDYNQNYPWLSGRTRGYEKQYDNYNIYNIEETNVKSKPVESSNGNSNYKDYQRPVWRTRGFGRPFDNHNHYNVEETRQRVQVQITKPSFYILPPPTRSPPSTSIQEENSSDNLYDDHNFSLPDYSEIPSYSKNSNNIHTVNNQHQDNFISLTNNRATTNNIINDDDDDNFLKHEDNFNSHSAPNIDIPIKIKPTSIRQSIPPMRLKGTISEGLRKANPPLQVNVPLHAMLRAANFKNSPARNTRHRFKLRDKPRGGNRPRFDLDLVGNSQNQRNFIQPSSSNLKNMRSDVQSFRENFMNIGNNLKSFRENLKKKNDFQPIRENFMKIGDNIKPVLDNFHSSETQNRQNDDKNGSTSFKVIKLENLYDDNRRTTDDHQVQNKPQLNNKMQIKPIQPKNGKKTNFKMHDAKLDAKIAPNNKPLKPLQPVKIVHEKLTVEKTPIKDAFKPSPKDPRGFKKIPTTNNNPPQAKIKNNHQTITKPQDPLPQVKKGLQVFKTTIQPKFSSLYEATPIPNIYTDDKNNQNLYNDHNDFSFPVNQNFVYGPVFNPPSKSDFPLKPLIRNTPPVFNPPSKSDFPLKPLIRNTPPVIQSPYQPRPPKPPSVNQFSRSPPTGNFVFSHTYHQQYEPINSKSVNSFAAPQIYTSTFSAPKPALRPIDGPYPLSSLKTGNNNLRSYKAIPLPKEFPFPSTYAAPKAPLPRPLIRNPHAVKHIHSYPTPPPSYFPSASERINITVKPPINSRFRPTPLVLFNTSQVAVFQPPQPVFPPPPPFMLPSEEYSYSVNSFTHPNSAQKPASPGNQIQSETKHKPTTLSSNQRNHPNQMVTNLKNKMKEFKEFHRPKPIKTLTDQQTSSSIQTSVSTSNKISGIEKEESPKSYEYRYVVDDPVKGLQYGHAESRDGRNAQGEYYVTLPNGRTQHVLYVTDGEGYKANVKYYNLQKT